jgi:hypothetical protein
MEGYFILLTVLLSILAVYILFLLSLTVPLIQRQY